MERPSLSDSPMPVDYRMPGKGNDLPIAQETLSLPFKLTPSDAHPFLTLGDYFQAIEAFLLCDQGAALTLLLKKKRKKSTRLEAVRRLVIRSEKHGALYHIASVEVLLENEPPIKLAVSSALSTTGKRCLKREYGLLQDLGQSHHLPYLPTVFAQGEVCCRAADNDGRRSDPKEPREIFAMVLSDWFEGFHEWHITLDKTQNRQQIRLWDTGEESRYLSEPEVFQLFKKASKILTFYYDPVTFCQIYPWHHAAGDFVVSAEAGAIQVRLVTVRKYASIMDAFSTESTNPLIALIYFFLNLTITMRLDRADGVGDTVWIADFAVSAVIEGFFEAVTHMSHQGRFTLCDTKALLSLLRSFSPSELERLFQSLSSLYQKENPEEYAIIVDHLGQHITFLHRALQVFPG